MLDTAILTQTSVMARDWGVTGTILAFVAVAIAVQGTKIRGDEVGGRRLNRSRPQRVVHRHGPADVGTGSCGKSDGAG